MEQKWDENERENGIVGRRGFFCKVEIVYI